MIQPHCSSCSNNLGFKSFWPLWTYQIESVFAYVSSNTQTVKIVVKTQIHMHWSFINLKIKIFRDFRVFVLRSTPKNENSEITETLQKRQNIEMWECSFKNNWNAVQITSNSKPFCHVANHISGIWVLKAFDPSGFFNLSPFSFMSILTLKKLK